MTINKLTAGSKGNPFNSKGSDVAQAVNALIDGAEVLPSIKQLRPTAGVVQNVSAFVEGSGFGGGQFIFYPDMSETLANGGTIIAEGARLAWDGTQADIATVLNYVGSGNGCYVRVLLAGTVNAEVSPEMFGAVPDYDSGLIFQKLISWVFGADARSLYTGLNEYKCSLQVKATVSDRVQGTSIDFGSSIIDFLDTGGIEIEATGTGQLNSFKIKGGILRNGVNPLVFKALSTLRFIYGFSIDDLAVESFDGSGISFLGNVFEFQLRNSAGNAKTTNTTGYGVFLSNSTGGTISSVDIFGGTWRGGKHGLFAATPVQDLRVYGGTYLRSQQEGVKIENAVGVGIYGLHVEQNWVSASSHNAGQAGLRVDGYAEISGVNGYNGGDAWQTTTTRVFATSGGTTVSGGSKNGTSLYNVYCSGSSEALLTLVGSASKDYFLSGSIAPNLIGDKIKGRPSHWENFLSYSVGVTHSLKLGSYLRVATLTGPITVNAPTGTVTTGDEIVLSLQQNSPGGNAVTLDPIFKATSAADLTAGSTSVWRFMRIGSNWVQQSFSSYV